MAKSFSYRLFGIGKIPGELVAMAQSEGVLLLEEGIRGSITYCSSHPLRDLFEQSYRAQTAAIVVTELRLLATMNSLPVLNVLFADERIRKLKFKVDGPEHLCISVDPGLFRGDRPVRTEYCFNFERVRDLLSLIRARVRGDLQIG